MEARIDGDDHNYYDERGDRSYDRPNDRYEQRPRDRGPRDRHRSGYRDRDRAGYRSPPYGERRRSLSRSSPRGGRDRSPRREPQPSKEIHMDGLPESMKEDDIMRELKQYHVGELSDVRVVRDKKTGLSRGFGFLQFGNLEDAEDFMDRNYPFLYFRGPEDSDSDWTLKVKLAYSRERDISDRSSERTWPCPNCSVQNYAKRMQCFRCGAARRLDLLAKPGNVPNADPLQNFTNNGDSDAALDSTPSQFLLLRGLEPGVTEELLLKGISKLFKHSDQELQSKPGQKVVSTTSVVNLGAPEGSLRRIFLIRDRHTDDSWRYGFAEYRTIEDAQAALTKFHSLDKFTISSKPVWISYIHPGVFVPDLNHDQPEKYTFKATNNPALLLAYWDAGAYANEHVVACDNSPSAAAGSQTTGEAESRKNGLDTGKDSSAKQTKKRKAENVATPTNKKVMPSHLQLWTNRHAELHGGKKENEESQGDTSGPDSKPNVSHVQSYADVNRKCCLLCTRQFKSVEEVHKHERLSKLHQGNLENIDLRNKALERLRKAGIPVTVPPIAEPSSPTGSGQEYRDRAKERRKLELAAGNAGDQSLTPNREKVKLSLGKKSSSNIRPPSPEPEPSPALSKGASLLGKMGWSAGSGLGADGSGRTAPVQTELYREGVGLGAQGGKIGDALEEADRNTKGDYGTFVARTKEKAKERFESLG
ncbi:hypothetical protein P152DRAFT_141819 [Eremomyces bilateralis CBS 781.70]|uniref:RNA-binding domain-containing protein n=1 Tax=Eremomyces bilateralis CBS 781.70 TaxID=1392243 RepID=A0A6G1FVZ1_9PEZI|nr:uncharacterized protein P152DRAFT_141819 [Eremomyces bilateralis CBS 781.70]KAF1809888.1 hypothetical protein P152DRAFT_141819 [Eremomyces bilateralis CBS 781.70]